MLAKLFILNIFTICFHKKDLVPLSKKKKPLVCKSKALQHY